MQTDQHRKMLFCQQLSANRAVRRVVHGQLKASDNDQIIHYNINLYNAINTQQMLML